MQVLSSAAIDKQEINDESFSSHSVAVNIFLCSRKYVSDYLTDIFPGEVGGRGSWGGGAKHLQAENQLRQNKRKLK